MTNYVIGIDCGGTKTRGIAYDLNKQQLLQVQEGPGNIVLNKTATLEHIHKLLLMILSKQEGTCLGVMIGIAGIDATGEQKEIKAAICQKHGLLPEQVVIVSDAKMGMVANLEGNDGIYVIAGTGSVVYGFFDGLDYRVGGWGHLFSDEGSGYWIAKELYCSLANTMDQGLPLAPYQKKMLQTLQVSSAKQAIANAYLLDKGGIAGLAAKMSPLSSDYPELAEIFYSAGSKLAQQVETLLQQVPRLPEKIILAFGGSVLEKNLEVRQAMLEPLIQKYPIVLQPVQHESTFAAWIYFLQQDSEK